MNPQTNTFQASIINYVSTNRPASRMASREVSLQYYKICLLFSAEIITKVKKKSRKFLGVGGGGGASKNLEWKFQGVGGLSSKPSIGGGVWIFCITTQCHQDSIDHRICKVFPPKSCSKR